MSIRAVRVAAWVLAAVWCAVVAALMLRLRRDISADAGSLALGLAVTGVVAIAVTAFAQTQPTRARLAALVFAFVASAGWLAHDVGWASGAGRHDGQAGLVWFDPLLAVFGLAIGIAATQIADRLRERART